MSDSLEAEVEAIMARLLPPPARWTLAEAADHLGCQVETLRVRIRRGRLSATRGGNGRYLVKVSEVLQMKNPPRHRKRQLSPAQEARLWRPFERLLDGGTRLEAQDFELIEQVRADPDMDRHLFNHLVVLAFGLAGLNVEETAEQVGITTRQVRRLRLVGLGAALAAAYRRRARAERGRFRARAPELLADLRARLESGGFVIARRNPRSGESGARGGRPARVALVRKLDHRQVDHLGSRGVTEEEIAAIRLLGIGSDELNHLILTGFQRSDQPTQLKPNP